MHGHLQLGLCIAARWQRENKRKCDAIFLCGDVGTFTSEDQLDNATRRHAKSNACELEFLNLWSRTPQPEWIDKLFQPTVIGGLGLDETPVVMVHGNHEGFSNLQSILPEKAPLKPVPIDSLPAVDPAARIRYLPSGWQCRTRTELIVSGIGGIELGQREAKYHSLAYLDRKNINRLEKLERADILITHQGPALTQNEGGSHLLDGLLGPRIARAWFHGHSVHNPEIREIRGTTVVPLHDIAFHSLKDSPDDPGIDGWAMVHFDTAGGVQVQRERPAFWREYRKRKWQMVGDVLKCPDL